MFCDDGIVEDEKERDAGQSTNATKVLAKRKRHIKSTTTRALIKQTAEIDF